MGKTVLYEGPDISKHQGTVNIKAVRDAGYKRIGLRVGYGQNNVDQKYIANAEACYNLEIPVMLYWFSYALTAEMAAQEARYAIEQARKYWKCCPIAYDLEYDSRAYAAKNGINIGKQLATDMAVAFLKVIRDAGYLPVIYTNKDYLRNYFDLIRITAELGDVYVWYARYANTISDAELDDVDIWQHTSTGKIPGISGNVDLNRFYTDFCMEQTAQREPKCNLYIKRFQMAANADGYLDQNEKELETDGVDGPKTQFVRKKILLKAKWTMQGYRVGSTGAVVRWLQIRLKDMGYTVKVDGQYGKETREAVIAFQRKQNLDVDGVAGYNTLQMIFYV